jgi:DeoR/GlpR family transcriptional regulator of sugar metabolism
MIKNTHGSVVVLADHSKAGQVSNFVSAGLEAVDILITDEGTPEEFIEAVEARGVEVILA